MVDDYRLGTMLLGASKLPALVWQFQSSTNFSASVLGDHASTEKFGRRHSIGFVARDRRSRRQHKIRQHANMTAWFRR
jgi:hypothetical protein